MAEDDDFEAFLEQTAGVAAGTLRHVTSAAPAALAESGEAENKDDDDWADFVTARDDAPVVPTHVPSSTGDSCLEISTEGIASAAAKISQPRAASDVDDDEWGDFAGSSATGPGASQPPEAASSAEMAGCSVLEPAVAAEPVARRTDGGGWDAFGEPGGGAATEPPGPLPGEEGTEGAEGELPTTAHGAQGDFAASLGPGPADAVVEAEAAGGLATTDPEGSPFFPEATALELPAELEQARGECVDVTEPSAGVTVTPAIPPLPDGESHPSVAAAQEQQGQPPAALGDADEWGDFADPPATAPPPPAAAAEPGLPPQDTLSLTKVPEELASPMDVKEGASGDLALEDVDDWGDFAESRGAVPVEVATDAGIAAEGTPNAAGASELLTQTDAVAVQDLLGAPAEGGGGRPDVTEPGNGGRVEPPAPPDPERAPGETILIIDDTHAVEFQGGAQAVPASPVEAAYVVGVLGPLPDLLPGAPSDDAEAGGLAVPQPAPSDGLAAALDGATAALAQGGQSLEEEEEGDNWGDFEGSRGAVLPAQTKAADDSEGADAPLAAVESAPPVPEKAAQQTTPDEDSGWEGTASSHMPLRTVPEDAPAAGIGGVAAVVETLEVSLADYPPTQSDASQGVPAEWADDSGEPGKFAEPSTAGVPEPAARLATSEEFDPAATPEGAKAALTQDEDPPLQRIDAEEEDESGHFNESRGLALPDGALAADDLGGTAAPPAAADSDLAPPTGAERGTVEEEADKWGDFAESRGAPSPEAVPRGAPPLGIVHEGVPHGVVDNREGETQTAPSQVEGPAPTAAAEAAEVEQSMVEEVDDEWGDFAESRGAPPLDMVHEGVPHGAVDGGEGEIQTALAQVEGLAPTAAAEAAEEPPPVRPDPVEDEDDDAWGEFAESRGAPPSANSIVEDNPQALGDDRAGEAARPPAGEEDEEWGAFAEGGGPVDSGDGPSGAEPPAPTPALPGEETEDWGDFAEAEEADSLPPPPAATGEPTVPAPTPVPTPPSPAVEALPPSDPLPLQLFQLLYPPQSPPDLAQQLWRAMAVAVPPSRPAVETLAAAPHPAVPPAWHFLPDPEVVFESERRPPPLTAAPDLEWVLRDHLMSLVGFHPHPDRPRPTALPTPAPGAAPDPYSSLVDHADGAEAPATGLPVSPLPSSTELSVSPLESPASAANATWELKDPGLGEGPAAVAAPAAAAGEEPGPALPTAESAVLDISIRALASAAVPAAADPVVVEGEAEDFADFGDFEDAGSPTPTVPPAAVTAVAAAPSAAVGVAAPAPAPAPSAAAGRPSSGLTGAPTAYEDPIFDVPVASWPYSPAAAAEVQVASPSPPLSVTNGVPAADPAPPTVPGAGGFPAAPTVPLSLDDYDFGGGAAAPPPASLLPGGAAGGGAGLAEVGGPGAQVLVPPQVAAEDYDFEAEFPGPAAPATAAAAPPPLPAVPPPSVWATPVTAIADDFDDDFGEFASATLPPATGVDFPSVGPPSALASASASAAPPLPLSAPSSLAPVPAPAAPPPIAVQWRAAGLDPAEEDPFGPRAWAAGPLSPGDDAFAFKTAPLPPPPAPTELDFEAEFPAPTGLSPPPPPPPVPPTFAGPSPADLEDDFGDFGSAPVATFGAFALGAAGALPTVSPAFGEYTDPPAGPGAAVPGRGQPAATAAVAAAEEEDDAFGAFEAAPSTAWFAAPGMPPPIPGAVPNTVAQAQEPACLAWDPAPPPIPASVLSAPPPLPPPEAGDATPAVLPPPPAPSPGGPPPPLPAREDDDFGDFEEAPIRLDFGAGFPPPIPAPAPVGGERPPPEVGVRPGSPAAPPVSPPPPWGSTPDPGATAALTAGEVERTAMDEGPPAPPAKASRIPDLSFLFFQDFRIP